MQQGHNLIFIKNYIHGDFTFSYHVQKHIVINNIIN